MTLQQQLSYAPDPNGWSRFNFQHYKKVVIAKAMRTTQQKLQDLEKEPNYQRPQQSTIN